MATVTGCARSPPRSPPLDDDIARAAPSAPAGGGLTWTGQPLSVPRGLWGWCRIYHRSARTSRAETFRSFGPLMRFDHHTPPPGASAEDPGRRSVLYLAENLTAAACEVFGEAGVAALCPQWRVGIIEPVRPLRLLDLEPEGTAMRIGALPALAQGRCVPRAWARAIAEDRPAGDEVSGIRYRTAYSAGIALALWDCDDAVRTVGPDIPADLPLIDPRILARLRVGLAPLHLPVSPIGAGECPRCVTA